MISKRRDCRGRKCTTVLHGGVCHRTSTPHKSGNKMKRKKKEAEFGKRMISVRYRATFDVIATTIMTHCLLDVTREDVTLERGRRVRVVTAVTRECEALPLRAVGGPACTEQDAMDAIARNLRVGTRVK